MQSLYYNCTLIFITLGKTIISSICRKHHTRKSFHPEVLYDAPVMESAPLGMKKVAMKDDTNVLRLSSSMNSHDVHESG